MNKFWRLIASGLGSGHSKISPGTAGSAAALIFWIFLYKIGLVGTNYLNCCAALVVTVLGFYATKSVLAALGPGNTHSDPQFIVIDEWAGLYIALIPCSSINWLPLMSAFVLFRFFDITKLGPIRRVERLPGAKGVMTDDLLAGLVSAFILWLLIHFVF